MCVACPPRHQEMTWMLDSDRSSSSLLVDYKNKLKGNGFDFDDCFNATLLNAGGDHACLSSHSDELFESAINSLQNSQTPSPLPPCLPSPPSPIGQATLETCITHDPNHSSITHDPNHSPVQQRRLANHYREGNLKNFKHDHINKGAHNLDIDLLRTALEICPISPPLSPTMSPVPLSVLSNASTKMSSTRTYTKTKSLNETPSSFSVIDIHENEYNTNNQSPDILVRPATPRDKIEDTTWKAKSKFSLPLKSCFLPSQKKSLSKSVRFSDSVTGLSLATIKMYNPENIVTECSKFSFPLFIDRDKSLSSDGKSDNCTDDLEQSSSSKSHNHHNFSDKRHQFCYNEIKKKDIDLIKKKKKTNFAFHKDDRNAPVKLQSVNENGNQLCVFVRCQNLSFEKKVFLRFTQDNWNSFDDVNCSYVSSDCNDTSSNGETHRELFTGYIHHTSDSKFVEFVVAYKISPELTHWDNNGGKNFRFYF